MPVSVNGGHRMPSWFDIYSLGKDACPDIEGIKSASKKVHELLDFEIESTGVPPERIIVGGFSQGGSLGLLAALTYPKRLAGILGLSCWLRNMENENLVDNITVNKNTPFLHCHGEADPVVPFEMGRLSAEFAKTFNETSYEFKPYPGLAHSSCPEELEYVQNWMDKLIPPSGGNI
ncbi:uncharacterized protein LOC135331010 [Halichondria panicea]|uniref:uncharacterized protein LOC135331010 n=1 Tax=Halichondria panicea TaxID=6063 RepID=UPI00312B2AEE